MKKELIKKSVLKKKLSDKGIKIGKEGFEKVSEFVEEFVDNLLERISRQARISGRKVIKGGDVC